MAKAGEGLAEIDGRFGLAEPQPEPVPGEPAAPTLADEVREMGKRRFWRRFVREFHVLLSKEGRLTAEDILERMDPEWIAA
ncbi:MULTISPECIES: hypothetical protein [Methylobacterium]|jgi:hypothetical protein|uniref:hypothetical protein n=1 Tax=Methylobacterium TaxID=407 RepID=UPI0023819E1F|nr:MULTISPECIES: hypothetical protein [Methylobacterium]MDE4909465.1 hypothetical protein [Methylobacterium sp. 092160098-2]MDH2308487.1 hypothetical protein [Methylobacterium brachiatum]